MCSPGFDLPIGRLTRSSTVVTPNTTRRPTISRSSSPECLEQSLETCKRFVERNRRGSAVCQSAAQRRASPGQAGAVRRSAAYAPGEREHAMLWILSQADGSKSLLDIAPSGLGLAFGVLEEAASALEVAGLMAAARPTARSAADAEGIRRTEVKVVLFCGGLGTRLREHRHDSEAAGQHRLPADPVAPDALLRALRSQGIHPLPGLSRRSDSGIFPALQRSDDQRFHAARAERRVELH